MARLPAPNPAIEPCNPVTLLLPARLSSAMVPSSSVLCFLLPPLLGLPDELLDDPCDTQQFSNNLRQPFVDGSIFTPVVSLLDR